MGTKHSRHKTQPTLASSDSQFPIIGNQFRQRGFTLSVDLLFVSQSTLKRHTAMCPDLVELDLAFFEQANSTSERRSRNVQKVDSS